MNTNRCYMIDLDGTIYHQTKIIPFAEDFIKMLQKQEIPFLFFTNSSETCKRRLREKLSHMGIKVSEKQILTAGDVAIDYVKKTATQEPPTVHVLGSEDLKDTFNDANIPLIQDNSKRADYVVIGYDPSLCMKDFELACTHVFHGATLISTNQDETIPTPHGLIPHTGAIVSFIECATQKKALNMGKPEVHTLSTVLKKLGCKKNQLCIIGDNLKTDILFAEQHEVYAHLVLTGLTTKQMVENQIFPPNITCIKDLGSLL